MRGANSMFKALLFFLEVGWSSSKRYVIALCTGHLIAAIKPLGNIILPKFILDELLGQQRIDYIVLYVVAIVIFNLLCNSLSSILTNESFAQRIVVTNAFVQRLSEKLALADYGLLENPHYLDLKQKAEKFIYGDMHGFGYVFDSAIIIVSKIIIFAGIITIIATLNIFVVFCFIILVVISTMVENWAEKKCVSIYMQLAEIERRGMYLSDIFSSPKFAKEIRLGCLGDWLISKMKERNMQAESLYHKSSTYRSTYGIVAAITEFFQQAISYSYLIIQVLHKAIGIGSFSMYTNAVATFTSSMREVLTRMVEIRQFQPYYEAAQEYLNMETHLRTGELHDLDAAGYQIEFRHVSFKYSGQTRYVLKDINFTWNAGEKLSLVGENGSGKTTIVKLLTRLYDPTEGHIYLNGVDIRKFAYDEYMRLFSAVFQDFALFAFSLKENVCLCRADEIDDHTIENVLARSGFKLKMAQLTQGIHTSIYKQFDETGFEPSGGEAQQIALARALYKDAPIIILDEPTAALDPEAEYNMYKSFDDLIGKKSALYISHRLSSCQFCDRIIVIKDGSMIEEGTHKQLMDQAGYYAHLYGLQASYYNSELV